MVREKLSALEREDLVPRTKSSIWSLFIFYKVGSDSGLDFREAVGEGRG